MPGQTETGHIRHGMDTVHLRKRFTGLVQRCHVFHRNRQILRADLALLGRAGENSHPQGLGEVQQIPGFGRVITNDPIHRHLAGHRQPEDRLGRIDAVPSGQGNTCLRAHGPAAFDHLGGNLRLQLIHRPAQNGNGHDRLSAHRVNITDGIGGGNPPEIERIIHHRHEEIGGTDDPEAITHIGHGGVIPAAVTHQQARVPELGSVGMKDAIQYIGSNLAATACAVAEFGQSDSQITFPVFSHVNERFRKIRASLPAGPVCIH